MNIEFPFNQDVENAQEKILQAKSAQEIKDLLKQDDPQRPNYQEGLIRLVSQHIMKQYTDEEIKNIENAPFRNLNAKNGEPSFSQERSAEFSKLASKTDSKITESIVINASQKHDPYMVSKEKRDSFQPPSSVQMSIANAALDHIKNYPPTIDKIFEDVLPKIKQDIHKEEIIEKIEKEDIVVLGNKRFIVRETKDNLNPMNDTLTFYDPAHKKEALNILGNTDFSSFKKELTEHFEKMSLTPVLSDVGAFYEKKGVDVNLAHYYGSEKNISGFLPQSIINKMDSITPLVESPNAAFDRQIEIAKKAGYVQGVCECVACLGEDHALGKKLLTEMNVNKDLAQKFANPETFKLLEQGIFAQKQEQTLEQTQSFKR